MTKVDIANLALGEIGAQRIITFPTGSDITASAKQIYLWYAPIRDEVLCEHPWSFAQNRCVLPLLSGTPIFTDDQMRYMYGLPSDFLKMVAISDPFATFKIESASKYSAAQLKATAWVTATAYAVGTSVYSGASNYVCLVAHTSGTFATDLAAGNWVAVAISTGAVLLSDTPQLKIKYIYQNDEPASYFPKFTTALASKLAAKICFNLTESRNKAADILERYIHSDLPSAQSADSSQSTPEQPIQNEWEAARFLASSNVVAQPGSQVWHYIFQ